MDETSTKTRHLSAKEAVRVLCDFGDNYAACMDPGSVPDDLAESMASLTTRLLKRLTGKEPSYEDVCQVLPHAD